MGIDFARIFTAIKEEPKWVKKTIIWSLIILLQSIIYMLYSISSDLFKIILFIPLVISGIYLLGYFCMSLNKTMSSNSFTLVEFSENNIMVVGVKSGLAFLCLYILAGLCAGTPMTVIIPIFVSMSKAMPHLSAFLMLFNFLIILVILFFVSIVFQVLFACYAKTLKFGDMFAIRKYFTIFKENAKTTWCLIGFSMLLYIIFVLLWTVLCITIVGFPLAIYLCAIYPCLYINLFSQYAKEIDIDKYLTVN